MPKGPSPSEYIVKTVADQSSKTAAKMIGSRRSIDRNCSDSPQREAPIRRLPVDT